MPNGTTPPGRESELIHVADPILGYNALEFTSHALRRMKERGVSKADVLRTLQVNKQVPGPQPPGRIRLRWHKTRRIVIDVVCEKASDRLGIITVIPIYRSLTRR